MNPKISKNVFNISVLNIIKCSFNFFDSVADFCRLVAMVIATG